MIETRLAFVDDHPALLHGMMALFSADDRYEIVGSGVSAADAIRLASDKSPDVLLLDLSMPGDVLAAIRDITDKAARTKVIVFTAYADVDKALSAIDAGAHGYVLKGRPTDDLYEAIDLVRRGEIFISPGFSHAVLAGFRNRSKRNRDLETSKLSPREEQIVGCLLQGKSNKEIARTLGLSEKTIKHYMTNLMNKLRVKSRLEVVVAARAGVAGGNMEPELEQGAERNPRDDPREV